MESIETLVKWFAGVFAFILLDLIVVMLVRAAREAKRLSTRVAQLSEGLPGVDTLQLAGFVARIERALAQLPFLLARYEVAVAIIRAGPQLVPAEASAFIARVRREIDRLRLLAP